MPYITGGCRWAFRALRAVLPLAALLILLSPHPSLSAPAEKQARKSAPPAAAARVAAINDANISTALKRADDMMRKGEIDGPLRILLGVYNYSNDVLYTVKFFQNHYERAINDPATPQDEKEDIHIKLKSMGQLVPKYSSIKEVTTYNIGYLYAKKGDSEKARRYLTEVLDITPFSTRKDSICMKAKTLLLGLYGLEGEF
ncbi:tetratricopeptide repeat protein [Syntrophorhabdus aromaticivorans]|nr:tetratricopeptide repeat protein [Syntrophorhabdus aromaticivorans]